MARMETESPPPVAATGRLTDQRELIARAQQGDPAAQRVLYDSHVDRIYRLTYRLTGREHMARELTQDAFIRAFAGLGSFRGESAFGSWLHTIAVSVTLNELKRLARQRSREAPLEDALTESREAPASDPVLRERLAAAVAALPEGCRTVFLMHDAEGYTHEEIASVLGVTPGTSKAQLSRSRAKLRVALADLAKEWET
jgi:RNA polymerase sigma-70 factor (ECF subfamily)